MDREDRRGDPLDHGISDQDIYKVVDHQHQATPGIMSSSGRVSDSTLVTDTAYLTATT
jgi:hypothetical protein